MKFCSECAHPVSLRIPEGDNRLRYVCNHCGAIFYDNPKLVLGTIPFLIENNEPFVLLCKRAIAPREGFWTLPAGFMENEETITEGALRETEEESGAHIKMGNIYTMLDVPHMHQVHIFYLAHMTDKDFKAGIESLDVALFSEGDIPWYDIAFPTVEYTLRHFFEDFRRRQDANSPMPFHQELIDTKI